MLQRKIPHNIMKIPHATTKTRHKQTNKFFEKRTVLEEMTEENSPDPGVVLGTGHAWLGEGTPAPLLLIN